MSNNNTRVNPKCELPPLYFQQSSFSFESLKLDQVLDISGAEFADCISFEAIIHAEVLSEKLRMIRSKSLMERMRKYTGNPELGVCVVYVYNDIILLIIDSHREFLIRENL